MRAAMEHLDWQANKTHLQCTKYMLEHEINCNVNLIIGEKREVIKAHKLILSMRSPVFDKMFNGFYQESKTDPIIPDICPETFKVVLRYCYFDSLDVPYDMALSTLYAAKKYILPILENHAREVLLQNLCESNIWAILQHSVDFGDEALHAGCSRYFVGDVSVVRQALTSRRFLDIPQTLLQAFLHVNNQKPNDEQGAYKRQQQNNPGVSISEIELFKACNTWAEAKCLRQEIDPTGPNKRTVLGECLFLIRFPTMLYEDLVNEVYPTDILTQIEQDNLCRYKHKDADSDCYVEFPTDERQILVKPTVMSLHNYRHSLDVDSHSPAWKVPIPINHRSLYKTFSRESPLVIQTAISSVLLRTDERIKLSKIWTKASWHASRVTIKNENSDRTVSTTTTLPQLEDYVDGNGTSLVCLDIEPIILQPSSNYSVTVDATAKVFIPSPDHTLIGPFITIKQVHVDRLARPNACIHGVTLSLV